MGMDSTKLKLSFTLLKGLFSLEGVVEKALVAQKLANKLFATEAAVDAAMAEAMNLLAGLAEARREAGVSAVVGNVATAKVAEAIATLSQARTAIVAAHDEMADVKLRLGIRTKMIGIFDKPPTNYAPARIERDVA